VSRAEQLTTRELIQEIADRRRAADHDTRAAEQAKGKK